MYTAMRKSANPLHGTGFFLRKLPGASLSRVVAVSRADTVGAPLISAASAAAGLVVAAAVAARLP